MATAIKPLNVENKLAPNPSSEPQFAAAVTLSSGETLKVADPKATRVMVALMDMQANLGGAASHFGGPSAFAELMSMSYGLAFHLSAKEGASWSDKFHVINDAGHCENGIYALKANYGFADLNLESLKGFRSVSSPLTGHGESHLFPEGVYLSNGPLGSSLPQAQGLALADKMAGKDRVTITAISDGACMEGEAKEAIAAIPGLAKKGQMAPFVMIVSDNNTKLSGRIDEQSFSMEPSFQSLPTLGWNLIELKKPHDLKETAKVMEQAIAAAKADPKTPVAIHARTVKGYGTKATAESASGAHGFPISDPKNLRAFVTELYSGDEVPAEFMKWCEELEQEGVRRQQEKDKNPKRTPDIVNEKVQVGVAAALIRKRKEGLPVVSVTSDLPGSTGVANFQKKFPEASIDVGVAESNMVSVAAGFSKEGFIPVVDTFSQFGVTKGALPFIMAALSEAPMIAIFSHAGFQDAADGASHQALSYFAMMGAVPNTDVHCLTCSQEAEALVCQAVDHFQKERSAGRTPKSQIFFLGRENFPARVLDEAYDYKLGKAQISFDNSGNYDNAVTVVAAGPMLFQAIKAAHLLAKKDVGTIVVNPSCINKPDVKTLTTTVQKSKGRLLTVEDHQLIAGMGSQLVHKLMTEGSQLSKVVSLGVDDEFGQSAYQAVELYKKHGMDSESIATKALELI